MKSIGAGAAGLYPIAQINQWSEPLFSLPLTVIAMAAAGAFFSFGYGDPVVPRKKLYTMAAFITFLAVCVVAVLPPMLGWGWVKPELQAPFAGLLAVTGRFTLPWLMELGPKVLGRWFKVDTKKEERENDA